MSTDRLRAYLERSRDDVDGSRSDALAQLEVVEKMKVLLREMFEAGMLDPYPTSDSDPQRRLRIWCEYDSGVDDEEEEA